MQVVNQTQAAPTVKLVPPTPYGYVLILAEIDLASVPIGVSDVDGVPVDGTQISSSKKRAALHTALRSSTNKLVHDQRVRSLSIFEAILFAPGSLQRFVSRGSRGRPARYDSIIVVETASPAEAESLIEDEAFEPCLRAVKEASGFTTVFAAANVKKIAEVDRRADGVFLWNFFFADDAEALLKIWDHTAGWWLAKGEMHNSELLRPTRGNEYVLINNARWDDAAPALRAFRSPDYWEFVLANIDANGATAMPSLYRLVR